MAQKTMIKTPQERIYEHMMHNMVNQAIQEAQVSDSQGIMLFRKSGDERSPESVTTLQIQTQAAEKIIGRYGITVWSATTYPDRTPHAMMAVVERFFTLENTPPGSEHYTLFFRKPVDRLQADKFNLVFYHQFTPPEEQEDTSRGNNGATPVASMHTRGRTEE